MDREQIEELLPFYALDVLSDEERELVERYLAEHPEARQQLEELNEATSALPHGVQPVQPSPRSKAALMARVAADQKAAARSVPREQPSPRRASLFENLFRALSLGAATVAILWAIVLNLQVARLQNQVAALNEQIASQSASLEMIVANLPQTDPSNVITVALRGTEVQPQVQGQLIVNPDSQSAVLVITGLPRLEEGQTYQVWLINGGAPVSAGLLAADENGQAVFLVTSQEPIGSFRQLGISIEPQGGSLEPTGDIVVLDDL
ncbi:MAG TPA: anti-sigma factor [Anaerolineales bacterium]|nr:anti-sigma factor [Anaerolineales bacterium]